MREKPADRSEDATLRQYVSTTRVAEALGVSVSTVKRWVDDGLLSAVKTPGGHRKLLVADVIEWAKANAFPNADLTRLFGPQRSAKAAAAGRPNWQEIYRTLRRGDEDHARMQVFAAYRSGLPVEHIGDELIGPALRQIGDDWQHGRIDVLEEHRASQICIAVLCELKSAIQRSARRARPVACGGAVPNDYAAVPTLLAQMVLLETGWEAVNLGPNTPYASLRKAVRDLRPRLVWLSACHVLDERDVVDGYEELYRDVRLNGAALTIGGRGFCESLRRKLPYTTYGDGLRQLAEFARTLAPAPSRPKRGRPPRGSRKSAAKS